MMEEINLESGDLQEIPDFGESVAATPEPEATFHGNTIDLTALGAVASAVLVLLSCVTCGMSFYCVPFIPLIMGVVGLLAARQAVNQDRTRLWSWIGVGVGGLALLLILAGIVIYIAFIVLMASGNWQHSNYGGW